MFVGNSCYLFDAQLSLAIQLTPIILWKTPAVSNGVDDRQSKLPHIGEEKNESK